MNYEEQIFYTTGVSFDLYGSRCPNHCFQNGIHGGLSLFNIKNFVGISTRPDLQQGFTSFNRYRSDLISNRSSTFKGRAAN